MTLLSPIPGSTSAGRAEVAWSLEPVGVYRLILLIIILILGHSCASEPPLGAVWVQSTHRISSLLRSRLSLGKWQGLSAFSGTWVAGFMLLILLAIFLTIYLGRVIRMLE